MFRSPVSLHPYFRVHPGQLPAALALLPQFVARTGTEGGVVAYEFTRDGEVIFCREAYTDAAGLLAHLENVGPVLEQMLQHSTLERLEVHGPAAELERLREPMASLQPAWFTTEVSLEY